MPFRRLTTLMYTMKLYRLTAVCLAALPALTSAFADGSITGTVFEKQTGDPLSFATVQLLDAATQKSLAIGTTTDADGVFKLSDVPDGKYIVRITNLGSTPIEREVNVSGGDVALGSMRMAEDSKLLKEVVVEGMRSQMRFELDRKVFNVDASIAAAGATASELLESIPSVEVDQDGGVSLRGNSSVAVWINGKESGLTADNRGQILEQLPAESIERIEVITNPSAKYNPEGTAGIINIVLKKERRVGYFGSVEAGANTRGGVNLSGNINYNNSKWEAFATIGGRIRHNKGTSSEDRRYDNGEFLTSDGYNRRHGDNLFTRLGVTYHITDADAISASGFAMFGHHWSHGLTSYKSNIPGQWSLNNNYSRSKDDMNGGHAELNYKHEWSKDHNLDITLGYNHWGGPRWQSYTQHQKYDDLEVQPDDVYQEQETKIGTTSYDAKIDYTNVIATWLKLEAGYAGNFSHEDTPVTTMQGTEQANMEIVPSLYNRFIYNNNVNALYLNLGGSVGKFSYSAGLRSEAWQVRTRSLAYEQQENAVDWYKKNCFALFPSAFLSYSLPKDNEVQINYTRRIRRPWGGELNSFRDISNPTNITYGNPELGPQYSNSFELNYLKTWTYHMISLSAYMRTTDQAMSRISFLWDGIMYTTTANVANSTASGCEIVVKNSLFRSHLDLTTTVNLYNDHMKAWESTFMFDGHTIPLSGQKRNDFAWDARMMASVRLPWGIALQLTGRYNSDRLTAQGSDKSSWSVDAGLRKSVGAWSFAVNCRDIFDSRKMHSVTYGPDYVFTQERKRGGTNVRFTVKYSFGNMKQSRKQQREAEIMDGSGYDMGGGMD